MAIPPSTKLLGILAIYVMKFAIEGGERVKIDFPIDKEMMNNETIEEVAYVLKKGYYSMFDNDKVRQFEEKFSEFNESKYGIAVSNCTSALTATMKAMGITYGDEVILPAYTYAATLMAVEATGAKPVFADIDFSVTINPREVEKKITKKTKAIIAVHMFGNPAKMDELKKFKIPIIEDCAHATGAKYNGIKVGRELGCHSFGETKILRIGEGGMITTNNEEIARKAKIIRHEGEVFKEYNQSTTEVEANINDVLYGITYEQGFNYRMMPIQAAIGIKKLEKINDFIKKMNSNARYLLKNLNMMEIVFQKDNDEGRVYNNLPCLVQSQKFNRDALFIALASQGIPVGVYFPNNFSKECLRSQEFCDSHIIFPTYPSMEKEHLDLVIEEVKKVIEELREKKINIKEFMNKKVQYYSAIHVTI